MSFDLPRSTNLDSSALFIDRRIELFKQAKITIVMLESATW